MKRISFFIILTFFLLQFCANQELPDYSLADVPLIADIDSVKYIPLKTGYVRFLPLETSRDCLIGIVDKVLVRDNRIYVADFGRAMALFVFDMDGKFLFKIARAGRGPGEYISFRDFDIHPNGDIYMFDLFGKKFLVFDPAGKYLKELRVDHFFSYFTLAKDKMYWSELSEYGKMYANLAVYHVPEKKNEFLLNNKRYLYNIPYRYTSYRFYSSPNGAVYYSPRFSEIIYSIDDKGVHPAIGIKNLHIPPEHVIKEWGKLDFAINSDEQYFKENAHIYETDKYISFKCINKKYVNSVHILYHKPSESFYAIPTFFFGMDLVIDGIRGSTGEYFFGVVRLHPEYKEHRKVLETREELASWKEEDNPVIVIFDIEI